MIAYLRYEFDRRHYMNWLKCRPSDEAFNDYPLAEFLRTLAPLLSGYFVYFIITDGQAFAWYEQRDLVILPEWCHPLAKAYADHQWIGENDPRRNETAQTALAELDQLCPEVKE